MTPAEEIEARVARIEEQADRIERKLEDFLRARRLLIDVESMRVDKMLAEGPATEAAERTS